METEDYLKKQLLEIKDLKTRIKENRERLQVSDEEITFLAADDERSHHERCEEYRNWINELTESMIKNLEGKIDKLRTMCSFDTEPLVEFIKDILTMIEKEEYQIKKTRG